MAIDIHKALRKFLPYLLEAQEKNLSEADTKTRIIKVFEEVLGYDVMTEITSEKQVKEKYVDLAIKIDGVFKFIIEVKAAGITLRDRHIEQAEHYAAEDNIRWVLLTNGVTWNLYHLEFEEGIEYERTFTVDLSSDPLDDAAEILGLLHRQSIMKGDHDKYWECRVALSPESIGKALFSEEILRLLRRQIRKSQGMLIDEEDLAKSLHEMFSTEARERMGPLKIYRKRKPKINQLKKDEPHVDESASKEPTLNDTQKQEEVIVERKI